MASTAAGMAACTAHGMIRGTTLTGDLLTGDLHIGEAVTIAATGMTTVRINLPAIIPAATISPAEAAAA